MSAPFRLNPIIKFAVSVTLLLLVLAFVDLKALWRTILDISPLALLGITGAYLVGQVVSSLKWWIILRHGGLQVPYSQAIKAYFIGMFVNILGIGTVGGDMVRALLVAKIPSSTERDSPGMSTTTDASASTVKIQGLASVVADRAHGLAVLAAIGGAAALLFGSSLSVGDAGSVGGVTTAAHHGLPKAIVQILALAGTAIVMGWVAILVVPKRLIGADGWFGEKISRAVAVFPSSPLVILGITLCSALTHLIQISIHWAMAVSVGASIPWALLFVAVPFINIASTLPISWQGLGIRENAYRFFFVPLFLTDEQAVACGAMWLFAVTVSGCVGGLVAIATKTLPSLFQEKDYLSPVKTLS